MIESRAVTDARDHEVAARLATEAGELLLGVRDELADATAAERKDAGDKRSHDFLMAALAAERPDDAVLSEEAAEEERANSKRLTRRPGVDRRPARRHPRVLRTRSRRLGGARGAVAGAANSSPARSRCPRRASRWRRRTSPPPPPRRPRRASSSRGPGRPPSRWRSATRSTACSSKWVRREPKSRPSCRASSDVYVHAGGQYEWDSAAPVAVARAAGLFTSRIDGSPLDTTGRPAAARPDRVQARTGRCRAGGHAVERAGS